MNKVRITLTDDQCAAASELRKTGMAWKKIARHLGINYWALRCELQDGFREQQVARVKDIRKGILKRGPKTGMDLVPDEVLTEREKRSDALHRRSITGQFFGDPPPGYSALDSFRPIGEVRRRLADRGWQHIGQVAQDLMEKIDPSK